MNREKLIKNEQTIRDRNRKVGKALKKYFGGKKEIMQTPLEFLCECADIDCKETISVTIAEYEKLHERNDRFLIVKGHRVPQIEDSVDQKGGLELVEKPDLGA